MSRILGMGLLGAVGLSVLLSYIITLYIALDTAYVQKEKKLRKQIYAVILVLAVGFNSVILFLGHRVLLHRWNPLGTAKEILRLRFSYQEICAYSVLLAFAAVFGALIGIMIRWVLPRLLKKQYGRARLTVRRKTALFILSSAVCMIVIGTMFCGLNGTNGIVINEVGANNQKTGFGEAGVICDYIELYNKGSFGLDLRQVYLSDDEKNLQKWEVPACMVPAKAHVLIPLDTAGFSVSGKGKETVFLSDMSGNILDSVTIPELGVSIAYSRVTDGADVWEKDAQTPGDPNDKPGGKRDVQVRLSHDSGFYPEAFYLSMETEAGYDIYYTLDGSIPDEAAIRYTEPVYVYDKSPEPNIWRSQQRVVRGWQEYSPDQTPVSKAFILRACAIAEDGSYGEVATATYFVDLPQYADKAAVSLVADPEALFGEDGIYVTGAQYDAIYLAGGDVGQIEANFEKSGRIMEIPAHMDYIDGEKKLYQDVGIRVSGGSARMDPIKRFSVYARTQYSGSRIFDQELFEGVTTRRIQIRDFYINAACQAIVADRAIATQRGIPVTLFLNGEYWKDSYLIEKYDEHYFQERYGIREDNIVIFKNNIVNDGDPEDTALHGEIYQFLESHDLSIPENYAAFGEMVDIQSYIDFICTNLYMNNRDFDEKLNNIVLWRARETSSSPYEDGKWRFALYDMDAVGWTGVTDRIDRNMFTHEAMYGPIASQPLFVALKANPDYRKQFVLSFMDLVNNNFRYENATAILDAYDPDFDTSEFHEFYRERPKYIVPYMAEEFGLTGTLETITLGRNNGGGTVKLNTTIPDLSAGSWSGQYYTDYPVTVTALPERGYRFVGWEGDITSSNPTLEITLPTGGVTINAIFEEE